ncbi:response regulator [Aurantiacibacter sp. MUD11]|uniref:response regulator transcription factor n=1 Tax=Aurantiacibacter sp. MUD11 TaxID=3003265 RepID=UPI0022AA2D7B|nr:response regulator [Aurantiacibacter sp. MUD11]WAT16717.1 response regulator [Aurantiacibacter sp. MUD11]
MSKKLPAIPVHIVDDDADVRLSVSFMLRGEGHECTLHESGEQFLDVVADLEPGCILLDLHLGDGDGLDIQRRLADRGISMPVVLMTGHGDVSTAVKAMKLGAIDFIQKPFGKADLMTALKAAGELVGQTTQMDGERAEAQQLIELLSPRERQVLDGLAHGQHNKTIAFELGISPRTVEIHRANAMRKLEVRTLPEMLHIAFQAGVMEG